MRLLRALGALARAIVGRDAPLDRACPRCNAPLTQVQSGPFRALWVCDRGCAYGQQP